MPDRKPIGMVSVAVDSPDKTAMTIAGTIAMARGIAGVKTFMPSDDELRSAWWQFTHTQPTDDDLAKIKAIVAAWPRGRRRRRVAPPGGISPLTERQQ